MAYNNHCQGYVLLFRKLKYLYLQLYQDWFVLVSVDLFSFLTPVFRFNNLNWFDLDMEILSTHPDKMANRTVRFYLTQIYLCGYGQWPRTCEPLINTTYSNHCTTTSLSDFQMHWLASWTLILKRQIVTYTRMYTTFCCLSGCSTRRG